jgi:hypothetical protein
MNDRLTCRNACLIEIVYIRRACRRLLDARGDGERADRVIASVLNINHALNLIEARIGGCLSDGNLEAEAESVCSVYN